MKRKLSLVVAFLILGLVLFGAFQIGGRDSQPQPTTTTSVIELAIPQDPEVAACITDITAGQRDATGNEAGIAFANATIACGDARGFFLAFYDGTVDITNECAAGWWDSASEQEQVGILAGFYLAIARSTEAPPISTEKASDNLVEACT